MNSRQVLTCIAVASCALAQAEPPGAPPGKPATDVQITHSTNDPAIIEGLSSERVAAQASYLFDELDGNHSGALSPEDVPASLSLNKSFTEFDLDGDGRIGLAEFQAYFAEEHYERKGDRWFPRIPTSIGGQRLGAADTDDTEQDDGRD